MNSDKLDYTNLKTWMHEERLSNKQFADQIGYTSAAVGDWINSGRHFQANAIQRARDVYRLTPNQVDAYFFGGKLRDETVDPSEKKFLYALALAGEQAQKLLEGNK